MADNVIELIIRTTDAASQQIKSIAGQLDVLGRTADVVKSSFAALAVGFTLDKLVDTITEAQVATNDLDRAYATFGQTVGLTKANMEDFADSVSKTTTITAGSLKEAQATLLQYTSITGKGFEEARNLVVDLAAKMGGDAAEAAQLLGRALQNPVSGIRLLAQVGVTLTQSQRATIASLVETGSSAEAAAYVMARLEQSTKGAAAALAGTLGGALTNLKNSFANAFEGSGANVDDLTDAIKALSTQIQDPKFQGAIESMVSGIVDLSTYALKAIPAIEDFGKAVLKSLANAAGLGGVISNTTKPSATTSPFGFDKNFGVSGDGFDDDTPKSLPALFDPLQQGISLSARAHSQSNPIEDFFTKELDDTNSALDKEYSDFSKKQAEREDLVTEGRLSQSKADVQNQADFDKLFSPVVISAKKLEVPLDDIQKEGQQVAQSLTGAFESFFESGNLSAKNFLKTMITVFEQILAKAVSIDLVNALGLNKLFNASSEAGNSSQTSGLFGAIGAAIVGHAGGGQISGPTIVGENGPELFFPGTSGSVVNQRQMSFAGGGRGSGLVYNPQNTITIVSDDSSKAQGQLLQFLTQQQKQQQADFERKLARNGYKVR